MLAEEGAPGSKVLLVLDGIARVERAAERLAEDGPGAPLGEGRISEGLRTSSNIAVTPSRVALFDAVHIDRGHLEELAARHRREAAARD